MRIGSQRFHDYGRNLSRMYWGSLEDGKSQEARRGKLKRALDELPWSIGEPADGGAGRKGNARAFAKIT
ncbi:MAG: hypothetical protein APF80_12660 [Alphaproteobacteria bacterium BRH_c36]|nr:MAG: hypothetical protein APF80_12660 [Alphaproteobacteria bacterium BRH_c36]